MYWTSALAWLTSLAMTCRRAPSSVGIACVLETLGTTCHLCRSPVYTPRTLEPEWCSLVVEVAFLLLVVVVVVIILVVVVVCLLVVVLVFLLVVVLALPLVAGVVRRL